MKIVNYKSELCNKDSLLETHILTGLYKSLYETAVKDKIINFFTSKKKERIMSSRTRWIIKKSEKNFEKLDYILRKII